MSAGSLSGASHTPICAAPRDALNPSRSACHNASGTSTLPAGKSFTAGSAPSSAGRTSVQSSLTIARFLMIEAICSVSFARLRVGRLTRRVHAFLERRDADAVIRFDEALAFLAVLHKGVDHLAHHVRHFLRRERRADHAAKMRAGRARALLAAEGHLVPLGAVLVDAQNADVADVMVTARIDTARDVQ